MTPEKAKELVRQSWIYVTEGCEGITIHSWDDESFFGEGEETGESYSIRYDEVEDSDLFYKLVLVE